MGITSVLLVILLSLPRVLMAIGRDGILSAGFWGQLAPNGVPANATRTGGLIIALLAAFIPLDALGVVAVMANMVTFLVVAALVTRCDGLRPAPLVTIVLCTVLLLSLPWFGWIALVLWWLIGAGIYRARRRIKPRG